MDVPPEETLSPRQLARPFAKPLPNDQGLANLGTFCSTCLKNQHLLTETLANYLPSLDDPTYDQYEASYPEFRQNLEERYPPVCTKCEPEVRQRIQQAGYTAKSDHLRRMMERSRTRRIASRWGWRSLVVSLGAILFWASLTGQLAWNIVGALEDSKKSTHQTGTVVASSSMQCAAQVFTIYKTDAGCGKASAPMGLLAIGPGLLSLWWNPKWQHKLQGREGRLMGLQEYYQVNTALLLARFGFWVLVCKYTTASSDDVVRKVAHCIGMIMTLIFTIYTLTRVKIDTTPVVCWQDSPIPLLSQRQYNPPVNPGITQPSFSSRASRREASNAHSFPITSLAPGPRPQVWQAPTPPPDEDPDAMEWEPSQNFLPNPRRPKVTDPTGPSPFHGALPAIPTNQLLHPHPQRQVPPKEAIGLPPGFFDKRDRLKSDPEPATLPPMAQPKFFSRGDREADTGLESIFDAVFSLRDVPTVPNVVNAQKTPLVQQHRGPEMFDLAPSTSDQARHSSVGLNTTHATRLAVFVTSFAICHAARKSQLNVPHLNLVVLCIACSVSLSLALSQGNRSAMMDFGDLVSSGIVILGVAVILFQNWSHAGTETNGNDDRMGMVFLFISSSWELPRLFECGPRRSSKNKLRHYAKASPIREEQTQVPAASEAEVQPQSLSSTGEVWQPSSPKFQSSVSQTTSWGPEGLSQINSAPSLRAVEQRPFYRLRSDSTDSAASQSSTTTTASTITAGWKTPNFRTQHSGGASCQSPGFNLRSLALDDGVPTPRRREQYPFGVRSGRRI